MEHIEHYNRILKKHRIIKPIEHIEILGVDYFHIKLPNNDDLYVTSYGLPHLESLLPKNHLSDRPWFKENSSKLAGTSAVFKVKTKPVNDRQLDLVCKWNRIGQDVPGAENLDGFDNVEFNSPFEEFALLEELRSSLTSANKRILTQHPLAIFNPSDQIELWQFCDSFFEIE